MIKKITSALLFTFAVAALAGAVSPAQADGAPTLPAGQQIFTFDTATYDQQLFSIDSSNANATTVGTDVAVNEDVYGTAVNPVDGTVYLASQHLGSEWLGKVNPVTGQKTWIAEFKGDGSAVYSMVITNAGQAYAYKSNKFFALNLVDATLTKLSDTSGIATIGYNGVSDTIYGFDYGGTAYTVNRSNGVLTADAAHNLSLPAEYPCEGGGTSALFINGVAFDANGNPWIANDGCSGDLLVGDFATGTVYAIGTMTDRLNTTYTNYRLYVYTVFITGGEKTSAVTLANTGAGTSVPSGVLALVLAATGSLVLFSLRLSKGL